MSIGAAVGISNLVRAYSNLNNLDMVSRQATAANAGGTGNFLFADSILDGIGDKDGQQKWGTKWLDSYRTVLIQRSQSMQRKLNNIYTRQLGNNLTKKIADNPNYSMANLPRMDQNAGKLDGGTFSGGDQSIFSMTETPWDNAGNKSRNAQDPVSFGYGKPTISGLSSFFGGADWSALDRGGDYDPNGNVNGDWGDWSSRQYNDPQVKFQLPWEHIEDYFLIINPLTDPLPPLPSVPLLPPLVYFDIMGFATSFLVPIFYPMFFYRFETFAHSEATGATMDAGVLRSDYNFKTKGIGQFPLIGQLLGGVLGALTAGVAGATGMSAQVIASCLDLLTNQQTAVMAPQQTETETGAFFGTTQALQDWDLGGMEYEYNSATSYVQDFIDTDFLAGFRKAGVELMKTLVKTILKVIGIGFIIDNPPMSFIADPLLTFIAENLIKSLLGPIRGQVELDTSETVLGAGGKGASNGSMQHVGDPGGLFGLTASAWEAGGFAAGYNNTAANTGNKTGNINEVHIYTKKKVIGDLWDGRGIATGQEWVERTYEDVSSRITNIGMNQNDPLNLAKFRGAQTEIENHTTGAKTTDADNEGVVQGRVESVTPGYYDRAEDYKMTATTKMNAVINVGSRRLNPSFGGGIKLTDLDTNLEDTFFEGSAAFLPLNGATNTLTLSGGNFVATNNGVTYTGAGVMPAPSTTNANGYTAANMGNVTFDATTPATDAYKFANLAGPLTVTYNGPSTLTGLDKAQPTNIAEARDPGNYRVMSGGVPITAQIVTGTADVRMAFANPNPADIPAYQWVMSPTYDADGLPGDDKVTDTGVLHVGLSPRVEAQTTDPVNVGRDTNQQGQGQNMTTLQFQPASVRLAMPGQLAWDGGPPATFPLGSSYSEPGGNAATGFGGGTNWVITAASANNYNGDGDNTDTINAGAGNMNSIEAADARKEAQITFNQLVQTYVPASFFAKQRVNPAYGEDEWNVKMTAPIDVATGAIDPARQLNGWGGGSAPPFNAANPYFWTDTAGRQCITVWSSGPGQRDAAGRPTATAQVMGVVRFLPGNGNNLTSNIEVIGGASGIRPVLMHRETTMMILDDDTALGVNSKVLSMLQDLRGKGYTQGRDSADTGFDGAGVPQEIFFNIGTPGALQPAGTPGDFTIVKRDLDPTTGLPKAGGKVTMAFTRPYTGITIVPPSQDTLGNPVVQWGAVNGWAINNIQDQSMPSGPVPPGSKKLTIDNSSGQGMIWALEDFSNPNGDTIVPVGIFGGWYSGGPFGTDGVNFAANSYAWRASGIGGGGDVMNMGRKFNLTTVGPSNKIYVSADDNAAVFVNGVLVGSTTSGYNPPTEIDVPSSLLRPGENFITVQGIDRGGPEGVSLIAKFGTTTLTTQPGELPQWIGLSTPNLQRADTITVAKEFTVQPPLPAVPPIVPPPVYTGDLLPGQFIDINVQGANIGAKRNGWNLADPATIMETINVSILGIPMARRNAVSFFPDDFDINIINSKHPGGTLAEGINLPLVSFDAMAEQYNPIDEDFNNNDVLDAGEDADGNSKLGVSKGSGRYHVPSDFLVQGPNKIEITSRKGGVFHRFCMDEGPVPDQSGNFENLTSAKFQNAGYWVNSSDIVDGATSAVMIPQGSLMYAGQMVTSGSLIPFSVSGGVIYRAGIAQTPNMHAYKPDSYAVRTGMFPAGDLLLASNSGYQMKTYAGGPNNKAGLNISNVDTTQVLKTFELKTVDRYVYDPTSQTIMDIMPSKQGVGPDIASETRLPLYNGAPANQVRNTAPPVIFAPEAVPLETWSAAPPPNGTTSTIMSGGNPVMIIAGQSMIGKAPVGTRVDKADRQTFGSDDNQLTRTIYAAMKPIDVDGAAGAMGMDARAYREYRDCFNMGYLDHIYIAGTAYSPTGGGFNSFLEFKWKANDVKTKNLGHTSVAGTTIFATAAKTSNNAYLNNYEYYATDADRIAKRYTTIRRGDLLMNSFYAFRKDQ